MHLNTIGAISGNSSNNTADVAGVFIIRTLAHQDNGDAHDVLSIHCSELFCDQTTDARKTVLSTAKKHHVGQRDREF